jgi:hypothetical protein
MKKLFLVLPLVFTFTACIPPVAITTTWYADADGDDYGNPSFSFAGDRPSLDWVDNSTDCNDTQAAINPGAIDVKDTIDNNCDTYVDGEGKVYAVGNTGPAGGVVFSVSNGGLDGLEAARVDQGPVQWGCMNIAVAGADGLAIGTGAQNTADIIDALCTPEFGGLTAAQTAAAYTLNGYNDWFLPSKDELHSLYLQKAIVGGFVNNYYWSSSEVAASTAWAQFFNQDTQLDINNDIAYRVRATRAF